MSSIHQITEAKAWLAFCHQLAQSFTNAFTNEDAAIKAKVFGLELKKLDGKSAVLSLILELKAPTQTNDQVSVKPTLIVIDRSDVLGNTEYIAACSELANCFNDASGDIAAKEKTRVFLACLHAHKYAHRRVLLMAETVLKAKEEGKGKTTITNDVLAGRVPFWGPETAMLRTRVYHMQGHEPADVFKNDEGETNNLDLVEYLLDFE